MKNNNKNQAVNPFLPSYEYVPDGEPHIFGDRVYLYGSHDRFGGTKYCMNDYVCYSAPVDDLTDWKYEGISYRKEQDPAWEKGNIIQAPDVAQGPDGRYYLYYALGMIPFVSVAVANRPQGPFEYYGAVQYEDGIPVGMKEHDVFMFDPGIFVDEDGRIWLYTGFAPKPEGIYLEFAKEVQLDGAYAYNDSQDIDPDDYPYMTQTGEDREADGDQYIANMRDGAVAGFKYFRFSGESRFVIQISGNANGKLEVLTDFKGKVLDEIPVKAAGEMTQVNSKNLVIDGVQAIYFRYRGAGAVNLHAFEII